MKRWPLIAAVVLMVGFTAAFSWFTITSFHKLNLHRFDVGNVEQVMWNVVHGHGFVLTDPYGIDTVSRFAFHVDPFLLILAPLYAVWPFAETLILAQVLAVASGVLAAYFLGRQVLSRDSAGVVAAVVYVSAASVQWTTIFPIHAVTFGLPMTLWMVYAAFRQRWWWAIGLGVLIALTKEQAGIGVAMFGLWLALFRRPQRWGFLLAAIPLVWSLIALLVVLPTHRGQTSARSSVYSTAFGSNAGSIISGALAHPGGFVRTVASRTNIVMVGKLLSTSGFLAFGHPLGLAGAPDVLINALSTKTQQHELKFQYNDLVYPWLLIGTLLTWAMIERRMRRFPPRLVRISVATWLVGWAAVTAYAFGPLPGTPNDRLRFATWRNDYVGPVKAWVDRIPRDAAVSVTNNLGAQFARREKLYSFPIISDAQYIVVWERHGSPAIATEADVAAAVAKLNVDQGWRQLEQRGDLTVWQRQP